MKSKEVKSTVIRIALSSSTLCLVLLMSCPISTASDGGSRQSLDGGDAQPPRVDGGLDFAADEDCTGIWTVVVRGAIEAAPGASVQGALFQTCIRNTAGVLTCLQPQPVGPAGEFDIVVPRSARCVATLTARIFAPDQGTTTAYCHLALEPNQPIQEPTGGLTIYPTTPATTLPALGDPDQQRTVVFFERLSIEVTPSTFFSNRSVLAENPSYNELGAAAFDDVTMQELCFMDQSPPMLQVFGFSPEGDFRERAALRYGPTPLEPGTTVPLFALGGLSCSVSDGVLLPEGNWEQVGTASVDAQGFVVSDSMQGVPCLIWLGIGLPEVEGGGPRDGG